MTEETISEKTLKRIRKMLALANNEGATEGERDNAMRMALTILAKHNMTLEQATAGEGTAEKRGRLGKEFLGKPWCISIACAIAKLYFCHYYYYQNLGGRNAGPTQKARHVFIGRESNVITAQEMAEFVVTAVNREAQRYQRKIGGTYADYRGFAQGAMMRIQQRCHDMIEAAKKDGVPDEAQPGTSLVLASLYQTEEAANKQALVDLGVELGNGRSQTIDLRKRRAHASGAEYGATVSLNRQVTGASQVPEDRRLK